MGDHQRRDLVPAGLLAEQGHDVDGPLVVDAELAGLTWVGQTDEGHHYADAAGTARVRVGNVTLVDGAGLALVVNVAALVGLMVVVGGYVRLTRAGLSIVEWNPISGVVPPLGEQAWQQEFAKYQQTPEFKFVNAAMTLEEYKGIFYLEWAHRLIARVAGLIVVLGLLTAAGAIVPHQLVAQADDTRAHDSLDPTRQR